jgi:hypothetical protein
MPEKVFGIELQKVLCLKIRLISLDMNYTEFEHSLKASDPPPGISVFVEALWFDAKGDWHKAHELVQDLSGKEAAHIHAYLHRKERDNFNADYWYQRAGKARKKFQSLDEEWEELVKELLQK